MVLVAGYAIASNDLARLALVKASILQYIDREPKRRRSRVVRVTFSFALVDRARYVNARITEGAVIYNSGAPRRALEVLQSVESLPNSSLSVPRGCTCRNVSC